MASGTVGEWLAPLVDEAYCYLTTTGRRTGRPHTIEIWFAVDNETLYLLSGGGDRSDWVRNLIRDPRVRVRIGRDGAVARPGHARVIDARTEPEIDRLARRLLAGKYQGWREGQPLSEWARTALPVAIDVRADEP